MVGLNRSFSAEAFRRLAVAGTGMALPAEADEARLHNALGFVSAQQPKVLAFIERHIESVVVIQPTRRHAPIISSTSFAEHPRVAFLARCSGRFVPPACVADRDEPWMTADNLLHESIHQYLFERARTEGNQGLLARLRRVGSTVAMPWRAAPWSLEQAYHGCQVYLSLAHFRRDVAAGCGSAHVENVRRAATAAAMCAQELASGLAGAGLIDREQALGGPPLWQSESLP
jgi:hypothetical protein